jgi:hypothetical protein
MLKDFCTTTYNSQVGRCTHEPIEFDNASVRGLSFSSKNLNLEPCATAFILQAAGGQTIISINEASGYVCNGLPGFIRWLFRMLLNPFSISGSIYHLN